ncbi:MAG: dihydrofolate reductase [Bacteroidetes bacterium]|nr:dihydrofolate reductase [Bacteroidota bacterium]
MEHEKEKMILSLIAAMGTNRVIGHGPKMPWHLPDELAYFMNKTKDHWVLMGRVTFEAYKKVMQNHKVIVVTSQKDYDADYALVVNSIDEGIELARHEGESELFISGGGEIFKASINIADRIYLTVIQNDFSGDVVFPEFDDTKFDLVSKVHHDRDENHQYPFLFMIYNRK